ncbi:MAG: DUF1501 domain-containing protein, partial [Verrucomicrobia bacterium]|nr:DUF1501 domain-containing protein [Verrucomicrobiota bacterium]
SLGKSHKAVIMIYLVGAPPHQDMYDLKMDAPAEVRGPFRPIKTNVPGIEICEHLPRLARIMDKLVPLRSVYGSPDGDHDSFICYTGRHKRIQPPGGWPSMGSVVSKFQGPVDKSVPPFVGLAPKAGHPPYGSPGLPGCLGAPQAAFRPAGEGMSDLTLNEISPTRLNDRKSLLASFDHFRRDVDNSGVLEGLDAFQQRALGMLTSSKLAEALDLSKEDARTRERYGKGFTANYGDGAPRNLEHFLMARRLVEAGARLAASSASVYLRTSAVASVNFLFSAVNLSVASLSLAFRSVRASPRGRRQRCGKLQRPHWCREGRGFRRQHRRFRW